MADCPVNVPGRVNSEATTAAITETLGLVRDSNGYLCQMVEEDDE